MTGVHLLHVLIGMVLLSCVDGCTAQGSERSRDSSRAAPLYWHMVDLLWVVIFTLLYLVCAA
jgi:nitric oxide reductase NorE protein